MKSKKSPTPLSFGSTITSAQGHEWVAMRLPKGWCLFSGWVCPDGDGAEAYVPDSGDKLEVFCFSGIPSSHINFDMIDERRFWTEVGVDERTDLRVRIASISDHLCSLFCTWSDSFTTEATHG